MQKFILCLRSSLIENWIMSQMFPMFFFPKHKGIESLQRNPNFLIPLYLQPNYVNL